MTLPTLVHKKKDAELWITNVSREHDVSLADLRLTVKRGRSYNLLDKKHFKNYTEEQIRASIETGSISKKSDVIKVREVPPVVFNMRIDISTAPRDGLRIIRKAPDVERKRFSDLDFDEQTDNSRQAQEQYAAESAELDFLDKIPALPVDPKFKKALDDE